MTHEPPLVLTDNYHCNVYSQKQSNHEKGELLRHELLIFCEDRLTQTSYLELLVKAISVLSPKDHIQEDPLPLQPADRGIIW